MQFQLGTSTFPDGRNREIRVFISSTFRDMQVERNELVLRVFPQLRRMCGERGVTFTEVDLRWGVTEEEAAEGKVLPICLAEIDRCRPFFIGLLGERYGWVPREIPAELIELQPWLAEHRQKSVTELEILYGVLKNPNMANRAMFYFRDPAYLDRIPAEHRNEFCEQDSVRIARLAELKDQIRQRSLACRENYRDPATLGQWVLEDLTVAINQEFPPGEVPDPLDRDAAEHAAFARSRSGVYIGRPEYFDALDRHAAGDGPPLVVLGESGLGKSALLANWAVQYRADHPDTLVLLHFIGATPYSADWSAMLRRVMGELKRRFHIEEEIPDKPEALRAAFANWLHMAAARGRVVLVLDALNQLEDRDGAPDLVWLPPVIPANVRMVLSTLPGRARTDLQKRDWPTLEVKPLEPEERRRLIAEYLAQFTKKLSPQRIERIASAPQAANPLYLRALLDELRVFGAHEQLDHRIDHYIAAETVPDLYGRVLERWEADYERDRLGLVRDVMCCLWAARRGLSESELLDLLCIGDDVLPHDRWSPMYVAAVQALFHFGELPRALLSPFYLAAEQSLVNRDGLLSFFHDYLRDAVRDRYLSTRTAQRSAHLRLADYFELLGQPARRLTELPWQVCEAQDWPRLSGLLSDPTFLTALWDVNEHDVQAFWSRSEADSPLRMVDSYQGVVDRPGDHGSVAGIVASLLSRFGYQEKALRILRSLVDRYTEARDYEALSKTLGNQAGILFKLGRLDEATVLLQEQERICRELRNNEYLLQSLEIQATIRQARGDLSTATQLQEECVKLSRELDDQGLLATILGNKAEIHVLRDEFDEAMELLEQQEQICRRLGRVDGLADTLHNQANILYRRGDLLGAMKMYKESEVVCREFGNMSGLSRSLVGQARVCAREGNLDEALALLRQGESICRDQGDRNGLQACLGAQASVLNERIWAVDSAASRAVVRQEMLKLYQQEEQICRDIGNVNCLAGSLANQARQLVELGDCPEALSRAERAYQLVVDHDLRTSASQIKPILDYVRKVVRLEGRIRKDQPAQREDRPGPEV